MKSGFCVLALFFVSTAFAGPKVNSLAKYKVTYTVGEGEVAKTESADMQALVTRIDEPSNLIVIQTTVTVNGESTTQESNENLRLLTSTLALASNCTLKEAKRVMALDPTSDQVLSAAPEEVESIFGKIKTCKLVQLDRKMVRSTVWVSDRSLGFVKLVINDALKTTVELVDYKE